MASGGAYRITVDPEIDKPIRDGAQPHEPDSQIEELGRDDFWKSLFHYPIFDVAFYEPHGGSGSSAHFDGLGKFPFARQSHDAFRVQLHDFSDLAL